MSLKHLLLFTLGLSASPLFTLAAPLGQASTDLAVTTTTTNLPTATSEVVPDFLPETTTKIHLEARARFRNPLPSPVPSIAARTPTRPEPSPHSLFARLFTRAPNHLETSVNDFAPRAFIEPLLPPMLVPREPELDRGIGITEHRNGKKAYAPTNRHDK